MTPTTKFRWALREYQTVANQDFYGNQQKIIATTKVLQQWWTDTYGRGEWRDVPEEREK